MSVFIYLQIKPNLFLNGIQRKTTKSTRTHSYIYVSFLQNVSSDLYIMKKRKWNVSKFLNPDGVWGASISVLNSYPVGISLGLWPSSALAWWWNSAQEKSTFHQEVFFKGFLISGFSWNVYFLTNPPEKLLEPKMAFKFGNIILGYLIFQQFTIGVLVFRDWNSVLKIGHKNNEKYK